MKKAVDQNRGKAYDKGGLECDRCGCRHFRVIYTRPAWDGRIVRRRECRHCGRGINTREQEIGQ